MVARSDLVVIVWLALVACGNKHVQPARSEMVLEQPAAPVSTVVARDPVELPNLAPLGLSEETAIDPQAPVVTLSVRAVSFAGRRTAKIENGRLAAGEVIRGYLPRLDHAFRELPATPQVEKLAIHADHRIEAGALFTVIATAAARGLRRFELVAGGSSDVFAVPVVTGKYNASSVDAAVAISRSEIVVWSRRASDKLQLRLADPHRIATLQQFLAKLLAAMPDYDGRIQLSADPTVTIQDLVEILAAVQALPDGAALFAEVVIDPERGPITP